MAASAKTKEKYKTKPKTEEEKAADGKRSAYFEAKLTEKIDESMISATHPSMKRWASEITEISPDGKAKYKCFEQLTYAI